jgi:dimethylhistidine N-methyltransferase
VTGCTFIDLGAGNCEKAARFFPSVEPACYVAVDISSEFLRASLDDMQRRFPDLEMLGVSTDFSEQLELPAAVPRHRRLFFYPGSSIGNFTPAESITFLASLRRQMHGDGLLWIGVDLRKPVDLLERAYNDELGVTAAFNLNLLRNCNRLAGTDFVIGDWRHVAFFNERESRIEMHLESVGDVEVRWPGGLRRFRAGERIHTENSYKHSLDGFGSILAAAGLRKAAHWTDAAGWFGFFAAVPDGQP